MSQGEGPSSSSYSSLINPVPTAEDYEKYDADRRLKEKARDMRVAKRSASSSSARSSLPKTPERKEESPTNDQYFTPKRESGGALDEEFVTPSTSKKDKRRERRNSKNADVTPVSTKPPRYMTSDEHTHYTTCLSRKMEENFSKMQNLVFSGHSLQEARERALVETTREITSSHRSPRNSSRKAVQETVIVDRSSSQPPPIETLNSFQRYSRPESPVPSYPKETPILRTSYVDTLVATHQMHMQYADNVVVSVEKQMTKLESMKLLQNLAALSPVAEEAKRRRMAAEALRKLVETNEQTAKKLEVIRDLKDRIGKITNVQMATHQLVSSKPFVADPYNERLTKSLDGWVSLPFHEFDVQTARELQILQKNMIATINNFKNVASLHRNNHSNRSLSTSRKSIALKVFPSNLPSAAASSSTETPRLSTNTKTREASTQVTSRLAEVAMTQTSPRRVGVEPLDLSSLEKVNSSSQTTPRVVPAAVSVATTITPQTEDATQQTQSTEETVEPLVPLPDPSASLSMTTPTMLDFDEMLKSIVLNDESLESIDSLSHFKSDISYPSVPFAPSAESTPRSGRASIDSESGRRLSAGVAHFLEKIKQESESFETENAGVEKGEEEEEEVVVGEDELIPDASQPVQVDSPPTEISSKSSSESQSPPLEEESDVDLNIDDNDTTPFEHEKEEQEEQMRLRESVTTPTPPKQSDEQTATEEYKLRMKSYIDPDDEQDETKKFVNNDDSERSLEDEQSDLRGTSFNDSADDSGFLLDNKPPPRLKSIFDNIPGSSSLGLQADTPRVSVTANDTTTGALDMEEYCQKEFLNGIGLVMVHKAIEFQNELRGLDWIAAQDVWKPPSFEEMKMDFYDHFDYFDSYSIIIWGAIVDLINLKYLKFGRKLTTSEEEMFEKEALSMLQTEYGSESKKKEWSKEVKMSKKLTGMMPFDLDYRYDVRRGLSDSEKQKYQWQQVQMSVIADRYPRRKLKEELDEVYNAEKEHLGSFIMTTEVEDYYKDINSPQQVTQSPVKMTAVSDV